MKHGCDGASALALSLDRFFAKRTSRLHGTVLCFVYAFSRAFVLRVPGVNRGSYRGAEVSRAKAEAVV